MITDFAVVLVIVMGLNGSMEHKATLTEACPREEITQMELLLEEKKGRGVIKDYGIICFPGQFDN
jgi:hypothetical protein|tara:strand:+ start:169 stop:363 length:195 start_codon:yes stop_codon:yes gene_type:complete